jgi:hypothetical protein
VAVHILWYWNWSITGPQSLQDQISSLIVQSCYSKTFHYLRILIHNRLLGKETHVPHNLLYTGHKISVSLSYIIVRGERKMERARGEQDALYTITFPLSPYLGWLATSVCICNGQRSSEISCDKYIGLWLNLSHVSSLHQSSLNFHLSAVWNWPIEEETYAKPLASSTSHLLSDASFTLNCLFYDASFTFICLSYDASFTLICLISLLLKIVSSL